MRKTSLFKIWLAPIVTFVFIALVVAITAVLFHQTEKTHQIEKSLQISTAISRNMSREIEFRLQALKVVSSNIKKAPTKIEFENLAKLLRSEYSGFFAINFVSADGTISRVYPRTENIAAEGRNLLERTDVGPYLIDSKADGQPRASHRIMTYQKIHAVVLYVPLFDKENNFFGWMNGVLSIDHCLIHYMEDKNLAGASARVRWHHPSETSVLSYNWNNPAEFHTSEYKIMNQTLSIDMALGKSPLDEKRQMLYITTLVLRTTLLLIISFLVVLLTLSRIKLQNTNEQLAFKNNMLNSLSHDLASPLTSLNLVIDSAVEKGELTTTTREKINKLLKTIDGMLKSVRLLHGYGTGGKSIPIENVSLLGAVKDAINSIDQIANTKKIKFEISPDLDSSLVVKANAHTLANNVLSNALSNAIKFSLVEGTVQISHRIENNQLSLIIADQGAGLSPGDLHKFKLLSSIDTRVGTQGEVGTGLGLLQISGFMKIYGGHVSLESNEPKGTRLILTFEMV